MHRSGKLIFTQLILTVAAIACGIIMVAAIGFNVSDSFNSEIIMGVLFGFLLVILIIAQLIIGIIQIVFASKDKSGGIFLASGILHIVGIILFIALFVSIAALVVDIIAMVKANNDKKTKELEV